MTSLQQLANDLMIHVLHDMENELVAIEEDKAMAALACVDPARVILHKHNMSEQSIRAFLESADAQHIRALE